MKGTYDISVDTPKRHRLGTLALDVQGDKLFAHLEAGDLGCIEASGTRDDKNLEFSGSCEVEGVGKVDYHLTGQVWANTLDTTAETNFGTVSIYGTRTSAAIGDFHRETENWAGRWSDGG
ncbi:MAG: hypothetical protein ACOX69_05535 [Coriobacteriales bacterium]